MNLIQIYLKLKSYNNMKEQQYVFSERKIYDQLLNRKFRIYYNEIEDTETSSYINDANIKVIDSHTIYKYNILDIDSIDKRSIVSSLMKLKYSIDDELAIQRQKDSKPEEFNDYNVYAEECKIIADEILNKINQEL